MAKKIWLSRDKDHPDTIKLWYKKPQGIMGNFGGDRDFIYRMPLKVFQTIFQFTPVKGRTIWFTAYTYKKANIKRV